jgi:chromosome segregation ATPase
MEKKKKDKIFTDKAVFDFMEAYEKRINELKSQVSRLNEICYNKDILLKQCEREVSDMTDRYNKICVDTNRYLNEVQMLKQSVETYRQSIETFYKPTIVTANMLIEEKNKKLEELKNKLVEKP